MARRSLRILADSFYREGILSIEAAAHTFMDVSKLGWGQKVEEFKSHKFELEKEYRQFLNPSKVEEYLQLVEKTQGMMACIHLHDYVLTVEAKYLQMFLIFHIYTDNIEGVVDQFDLFNRHHQQLTSRLRKVVGVDQVVREHRHGQHLYRNVSHLTIACMNNKTDEVAALIERCEMTVSEKVSRRNRHQGRSPLEGLSLLFVAAENGAVDVCRYLLARPGVEVDEPANNGFSPLFTAAQWGHLEMVKVLVEAGARPEQRCATVALSYGHSKVASYLQEALRQNEENKGE